MNTALIILQAQQAPSAIADSLASVSKKFSTLPDSISAITPEKLQDGIKSIVSTEALSQLTQVAISLGMKLLAAVLIFLVGRFLINKSHNLLKAIMLSRDVDPSLTTFLLSLFKITFFFVLAIIVISVLGIETSSFIAIFASAGIAIGMAFSGTLQNFAGGVLILLLKPYRVGDFIVFDNYQGTVKEIQIFNTIITTINNESIIIPNGGLSTGTINNYSREKVRRLEWRVAISYGDDVDVAREAILGIIEGNDLILKPGNEDEHHTMEQELHDGKGDDAQHTTGHDTAGKGWLHKIFIKQQRLHKKAAEWKMERQREINDKMPKLNFTPSVNVESLDDSAVTLVVRAWVAHENYWQAFYSVNEAIYKQLPGHGINFPFPQLDVHLPKQQ